MDAVIGYGMLLCPWKNYLAGVLREKFTKKNAIVKNWTLPDPSPVAQFFDLECHVSNVHTVRDKLALYSDYPTIWVNTPPLSRR